MKQKKKESQKKCMTKEMLERSRLEMSMKTKICNKPLNQKVRTIL